MLTGVLIFLIAVCSVRYHNQDRRSILIFAALCGIFQHFHNNIYYLTGFQYYLGAAFVDLAIISVLSRISRPTTTILALQKACLYFIYLNLFGWIIYELYYPPTLYILLCGGMFIMILIATFKKGNKNDMGNFAILNSRSLVRSRNFAGSRSMSRNKAEIKR